MDHAKEIPVLYQDDDMVVVSKPGGLIVHRDKWTRGDQPALLQAVANQIGRHIYPVHRLDRATSGVIAFALSSEMARELHERLKDDATLKSYIVVARQETPESFVCDRPLTSPNGEKRPARSDFKRLAFFFRLSLLEARIRTGRHHQIRRHLAHMAHQVLGDSSHGKGRINAFFREEYGLPRMCLHARELHVRHPRTDEPLHICDPLANDLREFLLRLPDVDASVVASI